MKIAFITLTKNYYFEKETNFFTYMKIIIPFCSLYAYKILSNL